MVCLWFRRTTFPKFTPLPQKSSHLISSGAGVRNPSPGGHFQLQSVWGWLRPLLRLSSNSSPPLCSPACLPSPPRMQIREFSPTEPRNANLLGSEPGTKSDFRLQPLPSCRRWEFWHLRFLGLTGSSLSVWKWHHHTWSLELLPKAEGGCFSGPKPRATLLTVPLRQTQAAILLFYWWDTCLPQTAYCPRAPTSSTKNEDKWENCWKAVITGLAHHRGPGICPSHSCLLCPIPGCTISQSAALTPPSEPPM